jgi:DNA-binding response OmpR family regulator
MASLWGAVVLLPSLDQQFYRDEHLFVHLRHQVVILDSEVVNLTPIEYRLLALLVKHAGEVVPRAIIFKQIWGDAPDIPRHRADPHIRGLRKKLGVYGDQYIETAIGIGYRFRPLLPRD